MLSRVVRPLFGADAALAERLTASLVERDATMAAELYEGHGNRAPRILWAPTPDDLAEPRLRFLIDHWLGLKGEREMPGLREVRPEEMRPALGHISLQDSVGGGRDFRYRLFGSLVARYHSRDYTGELVSNFAGGAYNAIFYLASSRAVVRRREPLYTETRNPAEGSCETWQRLLLPLADAHGEVARLLIGSVPCWPRDR